MTLTLAFVMNPMDRVNIHTDTSFAFMLEAAKRGHRLVHVEPGALSLERGQVQLWGTEITVQRQQGDHFKVVGPVRLVDTDCAAIFIRTDPPFDAAYLTVTWLLSFAEARGVRVINSPRGIRSANEKLYALEFPELCPPTLVSSRRDQILQFVSETLDGDGIGKPLDGHGGFGVVRLSKGDSNLKALIDMLTLEERQPMLVQKFLPEAAEGDKRLLVVDGELRGAVVRLPAADDHRGNVHVGGRAQATEITAADRALVQAMAERLRADGLFFVGLDVIGGKLIEVNVTSPTLLQELRDVGGPDLAVEVLDAVEAAAG